MLSGRRLFRKVNLLSLGDDLKYDGLGNADYKKHYKVTLGEGVFTEGKAHVNGIENFLKVSKSSIGRMRGIKKKDSICI